jgi:hypothetical protein
VRGGERPGGRRWLAAVLRPAPVNLVVASVLFLLPWAVAYVKVRHHHLDSGAVGLAATFSLGVPALWLAVAGYLEARRPEQASELTMAHAADQLAIAVGAQWEAEARVRRLNEPYPLPVSWDAADASLTDSWDSLVRLACSGAGWPDPPSAGTWATGPDHLAGKDRELIGVLPRVPTGRLVVLGEPGAGKTMLMVRLVLDLVARRAAGGPVPFLASIASWNPNEEDLRGWLGAQLLADHSALASPPPTGRTESTLAAALLESRLILPILDGLDEIPKEIRAPAINRINDALRPGEQVVVTCRTQQYRDTVRPVDGIEVTLRGGAAVELRPLDADAVRGYLLEDAGGPAAQDRWRPVLDVLGTETPAGQALGRPLMVSLARAIYNPRPGELAGALRDPAELCAPELAGQEAVESLLFDAFVPAAYRSDRTGRWKARDAERWLVFLARHLERRIASPDLAWWQLRQALRRDTFGFVAWLEMFVVVAVTVTILAHFKSGAVSWAPFGIEFGIFFGFIAGPRDPGEPFRGVRASITGFAAAWARRMNEDEFGFGIGSRSVTPSLRMRVSVSGLATGLVIGFVAGFVAGLVAVLVAGLKAGLAAGLAAGLGVCLGIGLGFGFGFGLGVGFAVVPGDLAVAADPRTVFVRDQKSALLLTLVAGLVGGLGFGLAGGVGYGPAAGLGFALAGGLLIGHLVSGTQTAWPSYTITEAWLAFHHRLPRSLMSFLDDAHQRGVLRQAGAVYQFRHIELQRRLATREPEVTRIGSYFDVRDTKGNSYRVTLVEMIDHAQHDDQYVTPDDGKRLVAAKFKINAPNRRRKDVVVSIAPALVGSNGQAYPADRTDRAGYTRFRDRVIHVVQENPVTGWVTFHVPEGVNAAKVRWTPADAGSTVEWMVDR